MHTLLALQEKFEAYFDRRHFPEQPSSLYDPTTYFLGLGGKRIRPLMCLMGNELFDDILPDAYPLATAIELFHNFTLIHDDIMDKAPLRRGKPTVHAKYGEPTALLGGDVMLVVAYDYLNRIDSPHIRRIMHRFNRTAMEVCEGQQWDMDFENEDRVEEGAYLRMIQYKTSVLLGCALQMGVLSGGGSSEVAQALYSFGLELGTSFQIHDDLLDAFGDPAKTGKQAGGDLIQGKKTILWIELGRRSPEHLNEALALSGSERVDVLTEALETTGVRAYVEARRREHYDRALLALSRAGELGAATPDLRELAEWLFSRES